MKRSPRRLVGLALVVSAAVAMGVVYWRQTNAQPVPGACGTCCVVPKASQAEPTIPDTSGLPCLVAFQIPGSDAAAQMSPALQQLRADAKDRLTVMTVDPDTHPALAGKWRLRIAPTQVLVSAEGKELWRHEGPIGASHLKAVVANALR